MYEISSKRFIHVLKGLIKPTCNFVVFPLAKIAHIKCIFYISLSGVTKKCGFCGLSGCLVKLLLYPWIIKAFIIYSSTKMISRNLPKINRLAERMKSSIAKQSSGRRMSPRSTQCIQSFTCARAIVKKYKYQARCLEFRKLKTIVPKVAQNEKASEVS